MGDEWERCMNIDFEGNCAEPGKKEEGRRMGRAGVNMVFTKWLDTF